MVVLDGSKSFDKTFHFPQFAFNLAQKVVFEDLASRLDEKFGENYEISVLLYTNFSLGNFIKSFEEKIPSRMNERKRSLMVITNGGNLIEAM